MDKEINHIARLISEQVGHFNGWSVDHDTMMEDCKDAAKKVRSYLRRRNMREFGPKKGLPLTPAKGLPMPRTVEHYPANALRDQELILEQRAEIGRLKQRINKLEQRFLP